MKGVAKRIFDIRCMLYQLYTREFVPPKSGKITKLVTSVLLKCTSSKIRKKIRIRLLKKITKNNNNKNLNTSSISTRESINIRFPKDMLDSYTFIKFEDGEFMCFKDWDEHLKCAFGDYMKLPPKEEQTWKHHPLIIDFERNFEEINQ